MAHRRRSWVYLALVAVLASGSVKAECEEAGYTGADCFACGSSRFRGFHVQQNESKLEWVESWADQGILMSELQQKQGASRSVVSLDDFIFAISHDFDTFAQFSVHSRLWQDLTNGGVNSVPISGNWSAMASHGNNSIFVLVQNGELHRYDSESTSWIVMPKLQGGLSSPGQLVSSGDSLFALSNDAAKLFEFVIKNESWMERTDSAVGSKPLRRTGYGLTNSADGLFLFGGFSADTEQFLDDLFQYRVSKWGWTNLGSSATGEKPPPRARMGLSACQRGKLCVFGGDGLTAYNDFFQLSLSALRWTRLSPSVLPPVLTRLSLMATNSNLFVFGTTNQTSDYNSLWMLDFGAATECANTNECISHSKYLSTDVGRRPCHILDDGTVKCWGQSGSHTQNPFDVGALRNEMGDFLPALPLGGQDRDPVLVSVSITHACILTSQRSVFCWGNNANFGPADFSVLELTSTEQDESGVKPALVRCFHSHTCAILDDGSLKCWGRDGHGALGAGVAGQDFRVFGDGLPSVRLGTNRTAVRLTGGYYLTCALLDNGGVKCWGRNNVGQLGYGDTKDRGSLVGHMGNSLPVVSLGANQTVKDVACGSAEDASSHHCCAVLDTGAVKCWGSNEFGQLGLGDTWNRGGAAGEMGDALPAVSLGLNLAVKVACGVAHSCALLDNAQVKCWGRNTEGQLGLGDTQHRGDARLEMGEGLPPVDLGAGRVALALYSSSDHTSCAYLDDHTLKCWGSNAYGQLGLGDTDNRGDEVGEMGDALPAVDLGNDKTLVVPCARGEPGEAGWGIGIADFCSSANGLCQEGGECFDTEGSYYCSCREGLEGDGFSSCVNVDECQAQPCHTLAACVDTLGSFECICPTGYDGDGVASCSNIDECAENSHSCHSQATCTDTTGSFTCACNLGFTGDGQTCSDVDECVEEPKLLCVADNATCTNTAGSFECGCMAGFVGDGIDACDDEDECAALTHGCHEKANCTNAVGSFLCACNAGFNGDGLLCDLPKLCLLGLDNCHVLAECMDTPGSFTCACLAGYAGDGIANCSDVNECENAAHTCHPVATCTDVVGSFFCECAAGYAGSGTECDNSDECTAGRSNCASNQVCVDTDGSFTCACRQGFTSSATQTTQCRACSTCPQGSFQSSACNATHDAECTPCATSCPAEHFVAGGCFGEQDAACSNCLLCSNTVQCPACQAANVTFTATVDVLLADFDAAVRLTYRTATASVVGVPLSLVRILAVAALSPSRRAGSVEVVTAVETPGARATVVEAGIGDLQVELQGSGITLTAVTAVNTVFRAPPIPPPPPRTQPPQPPATSPLPAPSNPSASTPSPSGEPPPTVSGLDPDAEQAAGGAPVGLIVGLVVGLTAAVCVAALWTRCFWARCKYQRDARPYYPKYQVGDEEAVPAPPAGPAALPTEVSVSSQPTTNRLDMAAPGSAWGRVSDDGDERGHFSLSLRSLGGRVQDSGETLGRAHGSGETASVVN